MVFLRFFIGTVFLLLGGTAILNFTVDPGGIYHAGSLNPQAYAEALVISEHGLLSPDNSFNERLVAKALANFSGDTECVVIGSSHVMQISSERKSRSLQGICGKILVLGVSGAGIEDHITLTYLALLNGLPKRIILGVDPWTLAYGKDPRWSVYRDDYYQARDEILSKKINSDLISHDQSNLMKLANLINLEYTIRSVETALQEFRCGPPKIDAAHELDTTVGDDYPVRLRDGSLVYSAKYISAARSATIPIGGQEYMTNGVLNQKIAIDSYRTLLLWIKKQGVEPILLMTPYHENVWKARTSMNTAALRKTEPIVMDLAHELRVKLIGSYDPKVVGCLSTEFYDYMHPTADCLKRLKIRLPAPIPPRQ